MSILCIGEYRFLPVGRRDHPLRIHYDTFQLKSSSDGFKGQSEIERGASTLVQDLVLQPSNRVQPLKLWVADDEAIYRNHLLGLIARFPDLNGLLDVRVSDKAKDDELADTDAPHVIVMDIEFGGGAESGLIAARRLRSAGYCGVLCLHSNRYPSESSREGFEAGADTVLPKPMSTSDFLKLMLTAVQKESDAHSAEAVKPKPIRVALVDDMLTFRLTWKISFKDVPAAALKTPESPE
jgi:DNA-binding NarL/FixJ family response regulator